MKKNTFLFLVALALFIAMPFNVSAEVFKYAETSYSLDKVNDACVDNYLKNSYPVSLVGTSILYTNYLNEDYVLLKEDGTCSFNVSLKEIFEARQSLKNIDVFSREESGKYYVVRDYYPVYFERFTDEISGDMIELAHYDKETIDPNLTYYRRKVNDDSSELDYASIVDKNDLSTDDIKYYYYKPSGQFSVEHEKISEISSEMYANSNKFQGQFIVTPRTKRVFYRALTDSNKHMVFNDQNVLISDEVDYFNVVDDYLFLVSENGNTKIIDETQNNYITLDDFTNGEIVGYNDSTTLIKGENSSGEMVAYLLKRYVVLDGENKVYFSDSSDDLSIKYSVDFKKLSSITVDGKVLDSTNYTLNDENMTLVLKKKFLNTLDSNTYIITLKYENGAEITTTFRIYEIYSVTFDANEGKFGETKTSLTIKDWNPNMDSYEIPVRDGYEFIGFFTEKEGGTSLEKYIAEAGIDKDLTFYAQWKKIDNSSSNDINKNINEFVENPKTFDDIGINIFIIIISLIGLVSTTIYLKKILINKK